MSENYVIKREFMPADGNPFWDWDTSGKLHMTFSVGLDHEVDGDLLLEALKETYAVWPMLDDAFIVNGDGMICFAQNKAPLKVFNSPAIYSPLAAENGSRLAALTYWKNTVSITGLHSYFDGGSAVMILRDAVTRYLKKYYGEDLDVGYLPAAGEGDRPEYGVFYAMNPEILSLPFERKEGVEIPQVVFDDPEMDYGPNFALSQYVITCDNDEFIAFCKKNGANPSVMLFILFAKAVFKLHPENDLPVTGNNTMNIRHLLGLDMSMMGQTMGSLFKTAKEDMDLPLPEFAKKLRASLDAQRDRDFILSRAEDMSRGIMSLDFKLSLSIAYMGSIKFGDATKHTNYFTAYSDLHKNMMAYELNGTFYIAVLTGLAGKKYAEAICAFLKDSGVRAEISGHTDELPAEAL